MIYQLFEKLPYGSYKDIIRHYGTKLKAYQKLNEHWGNNYDYYVEKFEEDCDTNQEKILAYYIIDKHILEFKEINIDEKNYISDSDCSCESETKYEKILIDINECIDYLTDNIYP